MVFVIIEFPLQQAGTASSVNIKIQPANSLPVLMPIL